MMIRNNSPSIGGAPLALLYSSACLLLLLITITSSATTTVVTAFTTGGSTFTHRRHGSIHTTNYYEPPPPTSSTLHTLSLSTDDDNTNKESLAEDYTTEERNTMKKLIESISLEPSDDSRRNRIERTLREYISEREDGDLDQAARFAVLFDGTLIRMGGEVQDRAREKVMASSVAGECSSGGDGEDGGEVAPREKSEEEKQLWAFVDMMVQSKSLIRKAMG